MRLRPALAAFALLAAAAAHADDLVNGGFETGLLAPDWSVIGIGPGAIADSDGIFDFDTSGSGASKAAKFQVGSSVAQPAGARLSQSFAVGVAGLYLFSIDVASQFLAAGGGQGDGGTFTLRVDGTALDSLVVGPLTAMQIVRDHLQGDLSLAVGTHSFQLDMVRSATAATSGTFLYADDASAALLPIAAVPEPSTWAAIACGMAAIGWRRRKQAGRRV